jgi:hypothetical protein
MVVKPTRKTKLEVTQMAKHDLSFAQYFYRSNPDGTTDSICSVCFWTVSTAKTFAELKRSEDAHLCKGMARARA